MAVSFTEVLAEVSAVKDIAFTDESTRKFSNQQLVSGAAPEVVSQTLPDGEGGSSISGSSTAPIGAQGTNQTARAQVAPSTSNKVPRVYGQATTGGVIIDASQPSSNTLIYAMVLSEMDRDRYDLFDNGLADSRSFRVNAVYRDKEKCLFSASTNAESKVATLNSLEDNSNIDIESANVINVYAWAGNSHANAQIFPAYGDGSSSRQNAYDIFPNWTSSNTMEDLVFAIVEVDKYNTDIDPSANTVIKDFGEFKFELESKGLEDQSLPSSTYKRLTNPAYALLDFLTSDRYGVGLANADIDTQSIEDWADTCEETTYFAADYLIAGGSGVTFPTPPGGTGYINSQDRYRIDAFINTQDPVVDNIAKICDAGMASFTFDQRQGKFKVLVNRQMTSGEKANAFLFNGDNIVSQINVSSTDIYSLFNSAEVSFPNYISQDLQDVVIVNTPTADLITNEPSSDMQFSITTVTDRPRVASIANTSLRQSRIGTVATFFGDHSTLQVDVGDFVKVTDQLKGWTEKYFRVMRINEVEQQGHITCGFVLTEYSDDPFEDVIYYDTINESNATGFGLTDNWTSSATLSFTDQYESETPAVGNIYVVDNPSSGNGNIVNPANGAVIGSDTIVNLAVDSALPGSFDTTNESWIAVKTPKGNATFDNANVTVVGQDGSTYSPAYTTTQSLNNAPASSTSFLYFKVNKITTGTYKINVQYEYDDWIPHKFSQTYTTANISIVERTPTGNTLTNTYGTGTDLRQTATMSNTAVQANFYNLHTPIQHDISNIQQREYTISTNVTPTWSTIQSYSNIAFVPTGNVTFVNTANNTAKVYSFNTGGFHYLGQTAMDASNINGNVQNISGTFSTDPVFYGLTSAWYPTRCNVVMRGISSGTIGTDIAFTNVDYRIYNKDPLYRSVD